VGVHGLVLAGTQGEASRTGHGGKLPPVGKNMESIVFFVEYIPCFVVVKMELVEKILFDHRQCHRFGLKIPGKQRRV